MAINYRKIKSQIRPHGKGYLFEATAEQKTVLRV